jgi:hypothetical protein
VIANFRETQLKHIRPGMTADVYLMSDSGLRLRGVVESTGYGVIPDPSLVGRITPGLPDLQRTLSWVHLASRYPVRIRIESPPSGGIRLGDSAVVVIRGYGDPSHSVPPPARPPNCLLALVSRIHTVGSCSVSRTREHGHPHDDRGYSGHDHRRDLPHS